MVTLVSRDQIATKPMLAYPPVLPLPPPHLVSPPHRLSHPSFPLHPSPPHQVMVATVRCEQIAAEKLTQLQESEVSPAAGEREIGTPSIPTPISVLSPHLTSPLLSPTPPALSPGHQEWVELQAAVEAGKEAEHFGGRANELAASALATYDAEAAYFEEGVRDSKRQFLLKGMSALIRPVHTAVVAAAAARCFDSFKKDLDDATGGREGSAASFANCSAACLQAAAVSFESDVSLDGGGEAISEPIAALLEAVTDNTWRDIRAVFFHQLDAACSDVEQAVAGFQLGDDEHTRLKGAVETAGRKVVEERVKRESQHALSLMKDRCSLMGKRSWVWVFGT
ncbi:unnamed protein product [Closterium sp. NIES-54]